MKKKNLQESLLKMKYLSGIISESQFSQHLSELEIDGGEEEVPFVEKDEERVVDAPVDFVSDEPVTQDPGTGEENPDADEFKLQSKNYFGDKEVKDDFTPTSEEDVEELYDLLKTEGVENFKKSYPKWVFESLFTVGYVERDPATKKWTLSADGRMTFRDAFALQRYLKTQDEGDYQMDVLKKKTKKKINNEFEPEEFELDEDTSHNPAEYNAAYKDLANKLEQFETHFGVNLHSISVQDFIKKGKSLSGGHNLGETSSKLGQATPMDLRSDEQKKLNKLFDKKNDTKWVDDFKKGNNDNKSLFKK